MKNLNANDLEEQDNYKVALWPGADQGFFRGEGGGRIFINFSKTLLIFFLGRPNWSS